MELINITSKAAFLGISLQGVPFSIIVYLVYQSIKKSGKINRVLFLSCFLTFLIIFILSVLVKNIVIESFIVQFIANILNCVLSLLIAFKISSHIIIKRKIKFEDLCNLDEEDIDDEYQDIYDITNGYYEKNNIGFCTFLTGLLLVFTDSNWLIWCDVSAKALLFQTYSLGGFLGIIIFIFSFLISIFLMFAVIFKTSLIFKKFMNNLMFNLISITTSLFFVISAINLIINNSKLIISL